MCVCVCDVCTKKSPNSVHLRYSTNAHGVSGDVCSLKTFVYLFIGCVIMVQSHLKWHSKSQKVIYRLSGESNCICGRAIILYALEYDVREEERDDIRELNWLSKY